MTTTDDRLRDSRRRYAAGEPITDEERELISTAVLKLVESARAADDGLSTLADAFSAFGKALTAAAAHIREGQNP